MTAATSAPPPTPPGPPEAGRAALRGVADYRRIALLTEGFSQPFYAKTAMSLLRYRPDDVVAVLDAGEAGKTAADLFGVGGDTPIVAGLDGLKADAVFLGIAAPGGRLPEAWRGLIGDALRRGADVVSGMHDFLADDSEFAALAAESGAALVDVRKNRERDTSTGLPFRPGCLRVHAVGHDCSVGKMVVTLELERELVRRGVDAKFLATGQTGIMIAGAGVPIDCVVSDFVNGAAEALVRRNEAHDVLLIEGQGSVSHPSFSGVTTGLLHGCAPHGLIYCYEVGRTRVKGLDGVEIPPHRRLIDVYETLASLRQPCRVIGVAINGSKVSLEEAEAERDRIQAELGLPVCDVYRHGAGVLADAVSELRRDVIGA